MSDNPFGNDGWTPARIESLAGKTFVITGANSGTGFQAARTFLGKGAAVVMLNRNPKKTAAALAELEKEFPDGAVSFIRMDLAEQQSVRDAAAAVLEQVPDITALICNAAIAQVPEQRMTPDGFESQWGVNHLGHFLLVGLLFERLVASKGRMVVVSSAGYKMVDGIDFDDLNSDKNYKANAVYCKSKLAQMLFAYELERRVAAANIPVEVHVCHPGASRTQLIETSGSCTSKLVVKMMSPFFQSAEHGSWPQVLCATEPNLKPAALYGPTKRMETVGAIGECNLAAHALDADAAAQLWTISEQQTGFKWTTFDPELKEKHKKKNKRKPKTNDA